MMAATVLAMAVGVYVAQRQGTIWRASSRLNVEPNGPAILGPDSLLIARGTSNYTSTQAELLRSTSILMDALTDLGGIPTTVLEPGINQLAWIKANLQVSAGRDNDIITIGHHRLKVENAPRLSEEMRQMIENKDTLKMKNIVDLQRLRETQRRLVAIQNKKPL